ncbi:hypothetical protein PM082_009661 [Marasmius tenuissimus]|nr:hypothetical protein PM082_009661 [Marasmius tenuissimus]
MSALIAILAIWAGEESRPPHFHRLSFVELEVGELDTKTILASACGFLHVAINLVLTILMAHKILGRERLETLGVSTSKLFRDVAAFLVESCFLYSAAWIATLAWVLSRLPGPLFLGSILIQVAGIAPNLLIVRSNFQRTEMKREIPMHHVPSFSMTHMAASVEEDIVLDVVEESKQP